MLLFKNGVNPKAATEIWFAVGIVDAVYFTMFGRHPVVTSMKDGRHMVGSLHHWEPADPADAEAVDIRTRDLTPDDIRRLYIQLNKVLPAGFDVVVETNPPHIHIEWQPKEEEKPLVVYESQEAVDELAEH